MIFYDNMQTTIEITGPLCQSKNIVRNWKKAMGSNRCKDCGRQFIADHERTYRGEPPVGWMLRSESSW